MRLADKVSLITGATSCIGRACALLFAKHGACVVVSGRNNERGQEVVNEINSRGGKSIFVRADITIASEVQQLVCVAADKFGKIDILLNSVTNNEDMKLGSNLEDIDESLWDKVFAVNIKGPFLVAKYIIPRMKKARCGVIINIGSMGGVRPRAALIPYESAKGAIQIFTKALAIQLAPYNIRVNCLNPGTTDTPGIVQLVPQDMEPEVVRKDLIANMPFKRLIRPDEIAYAALYMASDEALMLTGETLNVHGGRGI